MALIALPPYGQHIVFLGATGSGKSKLAEKMLNQYDKTFIIDTQDSLEVGGKRITKPDGGFFGLEYELKNNDLLHYIPNPKYLMKTAWDYIFKKLLLSSTKKKKNERVVYIDEIFDLGYGHAGFPQWLVRSLPTARQKGLSYWISTQEPKNIPTNIMGQASKIYVFRLAKEEHKKFVASFAGCNVKGLLEVLNEERPDNDFSFVEIDNRKGTWRKLPAISI